VTGVRYYALKVAEEPSNTYQMRQLRMSAGGISSLLT